MTAATAQLMRRSDGDRSDGDVELMRRSASDCKASALRCCAAVLQRSINLRAGTRALPSAARRRRRQERRRRGADEQESECKASVLRCWLMRVQERCNRGEMLLQYYDKTRGSAQISATAMTICVCRLLRRKNKMLLARMLNAEDACRSLIFCCSKNLAPLHRPTFE